MKNDGHLGRCYALQDRLYYKNCMWKFWHRLCGVLD
jgi:hypothetical protein